MKRTLFGVITLGLLAMAIVANGQPAKRHTAKPARTLAVSSSICSDPSKCPAGCSRSGVTSAANVAASSAPKLELSAGACNGMDPAKCPASCRKAAAGATAERLASR